MRHKTSLAVDVMVCLLFWPQHLADARDFESFFAKVSSICDFPTTRGEGTMQHSNNDSHNENISVDVIYGSLLAHRGSRKTPHGWVRQGLHELRSSSSRPLSRHNFREPSSPHLGLHDHFPRHQAYAVLVPLLRGAYMPDVQL